MNSLLKQALQKPIYVLLAVNLLIGSFVFRNYGLSWDEPLFYDYADALSYAYSPQEWLSGNFDLENSYGPSAEDHKTRGPAYLFLARNFVYGLAALGSDSASAWHLVNFIFFQLGVYFFHRFASRWMSPTAALAASAFFSLQPLLWGHAFINPKDPPFLVFFLGSVCLGFEMVDDISTGDKNRNWKLLAAALCLGIATSIRVLGPLAGFLVIAYALSYGRKELKRFLQPLGTYGSIAIAVMLVTWPYLWENPISRLLETLQFMSDNPTQLAVLFNGEVFRANEMPRRYLPFMLWSTLTEPTWFLFGLGVVMGFWKHLKDRSNKQALPSLTLTLSWFILLVAYVLIFQPAVYDGLRHFLFILPPVIIFSGFVFEWVISKVVMPIWLRAGVVSLFLLPGILGIIQLHPYEYTYYNATVGGTSGVFRYYETDYWLTCYKEAVEQLDGRLAEAFNLYVLREAYIARYYADPETSVVDLRGTMDQVKTGDYVLVNTRTNDDRSIFRDAPPVIQVRRGSAIFCEVKRIP